MCIRDRRLPAFGFPHDVQDRFVVGVIGVMTVRVPIGGTQVDLDIADGHVVVRLSILPEPHNRPREIGTAAVIPESGLDDFDGAPVVHGQDRLIKLLEPKRLDFHLHRRAHRFLAQGTRRQVRKMKRTIFHSRNLIPSQLKS